MASMGSSSLFAAFCGLQPKKTPHELTEWLEFHVDHWRARVPIMCETPTDRL